MLCCGCVKLAPVAPEAVDYQRNLNQTRRRGRGRRRARGLEDRNCGVALAWVRSWLAGRWRSRRPLV